jgi:hypothetical protein
LGPLAWPSFPEEHRIRQAGFRVWHHRAFDARAVLGVVNALRFDPAEGRAFGH